MENCSSCAWADGLKLAFPVANPGDGARAVETAAQHTVTGAPNPAWHSTAPRASQLPPKSHAFTMWNSLRTLPDHSIQEFSVLHGLSHATWRKPAVGSYLAWSYLHQQQQAQRRLSASTNAEISWVVSPALCLRAAVPRRDLMGWKKNLLPIVTGLESLDHHQNRKQKT